MLMQKCRPNVPAFEEWYNSNSKAESPFVCNGRYVCVSVYIYVKNIPPTRVALIWDGHQFGTLFPFWDNKLFV